MILQNDMAIDRFGNLHICYYDFSHSDLVYATNASGFWTSETIGSVYDNCSPSIAVDSAGHAHISYYDGQNQDLQYATNASGAWVAIALESAGTVGEFTSIAVDGSDAVHISCYDRTNGTLKYLTNSSGSWVSAALDSGGMYTSTAVDAAGKIHIGYFEYRGCKLKVATNVSGAWVTVPVLSDGSGKQCISLAVDGTGRNHIAYYNDSEDSLFYITDLPGYWRKRKIDSPGETGLYASVGIDVTDGIHIGYYGNGLRYATDATCYWVRETVAPYVWASVSVALDSNGKAHMSYSSSRALEYLNNVTGTWEHLTIDRPLTAVEHSSIAVDAMDSAHIAYSCYLVIFSGEEVIHDHDLKYATNASGLWVAATVDGAGDVGEFPSIALDGSGNVHISYLSAGAWFHSLKYATNVSGSWETVTLDDGLVGGGQTSIAVDAEGSVHISYYGGNTLKYATNASGLWETVALDGGGSDVGRYSSIAVDAAGAVHIGYSGADTLKYATNATGLWTTETVCDRFLGSGKYASLALGSDGTVCIGHHGDDGTLLLTSSGEIPCVDGDGDGYGNPAAPDCAHPEPDCDDVRPEVRPGAMEGPFGGATCTDGLDNNCNGLIDEADPGCAGSCFDEDGDGYGNPASPECTHPQWDCNDSNPSVHSGAVEICGNGSDDDCDGEIDEGCGYSAAANAEASVYGSKAVAGSGLFNELGLVLAPDGMVLLLKRLRRGRSGKQKLTPYSGQGHT